jgi:hypothetical protein
MSNENNVFEKTGCHAEVPVEKNAAACYTGGRYERHRGLCGGILE